MDNYGNSSHNSENIHDPHAWFNAMLANDSNFVQNYQQNNFQNYPNNSNPLNFNQNSYPDFNSPANTQLSFDFAPNYQSFIQESQNTEFVPETQEEDEGDEEDEAVPIRRKEGATKKKKGANIAWRFKEDEALISAYMNTSTDAIVVTNQKYEKLWSTVKARYDTAQQQRPSEIGKRTLSMLRGRWNRMEKSVNLFVAMYDEATRRKGSGYNDEDVRLEAKQLYENQEGKPFKDEHAWLMLKNYRKWEERIKTYTTTNRKKKAETSRPVLLDSDNESGGSDQRFKLNETGGYVTTESDDAGMVQLRERPPGKKAAKAAAAAAKKGYSSGGSLKIFRRRFRMDRHVFLRLVAEGEQHDEFFQQRPDATGRFGLSSLQKCTAAMRMLAYGMAADAIDEYLRLSGCSARLSLEKFCVVISRFGNHYLRRPNRSDMERLLCMGSERGLPGMLGSIDCMHWQWKNCPSAWRGQYQGRSGKASLVLEAVASHDLWIWHSFFGIPVSLNDINFLHRSSVFDDVLNGVAPHVSFQVNNNQYDMGYYLTDRIYPQWATFINSIPLPIEEKDKVFAKAQEACRKDVERAFGVLQARFAILRNPSLAWSEVILGKIMTTCIILHNMIVEDERDRYRNYDDASEFWADKPKNKRKGKSTQVEQDDTFTYTRVNSRVGNSIFEYMARRNVQSKATHLALKADLIEHIYAKNNS